jgi:hypothetical protein
MANVVPLRSGSQEIELYDPEIELKKIVAAEAMEKHFIREIKTKEKAGEVLNGTLERLHKASNARIIGQANYIVWRDGVVVPALGKGRPKKGSKNSSLLPDADPGHDIAHLWRKALCTKGEDGKTEVDEEKVTRVLASVWAPTAHAHDLKVDKEVRGTQGTGENEWFTPVEYLELVKQVFGGEIDLDPASSAKAQKQVQAKQFFTKKDNGLKKEWFGKTFLNPPYAQPDIGQHVDKLLEEIAAGRVKEAIILTHNYTDTKWFRSAASISSAVCFTNGTDAFPSRVTFESPSGEKAQPTQGQCFFYFGDNVSKFASVFADVGLVYPALLNKVAKFDDGLPAVESVLKWEAGEAALKWRADQSQPMFKWRRVA